MASASAQEIETSDVQVWLQYEQRFWFSEKIRGSWNLAYRELVSTEDILGEWSRLHLVGDAVYMHRRWLNFELGGGGYYSFQPQLTDRAEFRLWQGVIVRWPEWKSKRRQFDLRHRFRLEERWIQPRDTRAAEFGLRGRYRLATFIPINKPTSNEPKAFYLRLMSEWFGDLGDVEEFFAARVRLTVSPGYVLNENWTVEFRYTAQRSRDTVTDTFVTTEHILDFRVRTTLGLKKVLGIK